MTRPPDASPADEGARAAPDLDVEETRRQEEAVERAPMLRPSPDHGGIVELHFASGTAELSSSSRGRLDRISRSFPKGEADFYVDLQGHTDATGAETANLELAEHRAMVVREYLHREHDVPVDRMGVTPLGSAAPTADNETAAGRERNRRVVVVVIRSPD